MQYFCLNRPSKPTFTTYSALRAHLRADHGIKRLFDNDREKYMTGPPPPRVQPLDNEMVTKAIEEGIKRGVADIMAMFHQSAEPNH